MQLKVTYDQYGTPVLANIGEYNRAIASVESQGSGGYRAVGPQTRKGRAYGKHQVMDFNIGPWTKEVLGVAMTPQQFLANPQAQDAVFNAKFGQYVAKYGNADDAASAWFTGRPLASGATSRDVLGTSGAGYVNKFRAALGRPTAPSEQSAAAPAAPAPAQQPLKPITQALLSQPFSPTPGPGQEPAAELPGPTNGPIDMSNTKAALERVEGGNFSPQLVRALAEKYGMSFTQASNYLRGL